VQDALIGAAAGAILGGLFGDRVISTEKVLGGAAAGAVIGNVTAPEVAVIDPNANLTLTVTQDFQPYLP
jgi:outer membrane lipoprotein SlyB